MLKKFAVTNFKGFKNRIELDLSNSKMYEFNNFAIKDGIIKNGIIYGPNGSGKSNLGYAIFNIINHLTQKLKQTEIYNDSTYAQNKNSITKYEYTFFLKGKNIEYTYTKDYRQMLKDESLIVDGRIVFDKSINSLSIDEKEFPVAYDMKNSLANNSNNISIINFLLSSFPLEKNHYLNELKEFVDSMLWFRCLENRGFMGMQTHGDNIDEFVIQKNLTEKLSDFLLNVSGQKYDFAPPQKDDKVIYAIIESTKIPFYKIMSTGTSSLYLLFYWLNNMGKASFVFIDEFDAFYHYKLSKEVCKTLFRLQNTQILLTSHNTYLMSNDLLRPDCNFILDGTSIKPLCDCTDKELRWGHNIEKLYRGGAFSV